MRYSIIFPVALLAGSQFALALPAVTKPPPRVLPKTNAVEKTQGTGGTRGDLGSGTQGGAPPPSNVESNTQGQVGGAPPLGEPVRNSQVVDVAKTQPLVTAASDMVGGGFGTQRNSHGVPAGDSLPAAGGPPHNNFGGGENIGGGQGTEYGRRKRGENRARGLNRRSRVQARSPIYGEDEYTSQVPPPAVEADGNPQSSGQQIPNQDSSHRFEAPAGNGNIDATGGLHPRPAVGGSESSESSESSEGDAVSHESDGEAPPLPNRNTGGGAGPGPYELGSKKI